MTVHLSSVCMHVQSERADRATRAPMTHGNQRCSATLRPPQSRLQRARWGRLHLHAHGCGASGRVDFGSMCLPHVLIPRLIIARAHPSTSPPVLPQRVSFPEGCLFQKSCSDRSRTNTFRTSEKSIFCSKKKFSKKKVKKNAQSLPRKK